MMYGRAADLMAMLLHLLVASSAVSGAVLGSLTIQVQ
jgi:hypothetical protein